MLWELHLSELLCVVITELCTLACSLKFPFKGLGLQPSVNYKFKQRTLGSITFVNGNTVT